MSQPPPPNAPVRDRRSRPRRVLLVVAVVLSALLVLPVVLWVGAGIAGSVSRSGTAGAVRAEVTSGRAGVEPEVRALRDAQRAALGPVPARSHLALECELSTRDAGWIVQSYEQSCWVRSMDLYPVADREAAEALARTLPADLAGEVESSPPGSGCPTLRQRHGQGYPPEVAVRWVPASSVPEGEEHCYQLPEPGAGAASASTGVDVVETFDPDTLDPGQDWVAVVDTASVLDRRDIGCSPWSVLFCSAPRGAPFLP